MSLLGRLEEDLKGALRARDEVTRDTLRMVIAAVKKQEIDSNDPLTDEDVLAELKYGQKTRVDSAEQFANAGRQDLADKERAEIAVLEKYLPKKQLSEEALRELVGGLVTELEIQSKRDIGKLMKELMARHRGEVDGKLAQRIASELVE